MSEVQVPAPHSQHSHGLICFPVPWERASQSGQGRGGPPWHSGVRMVAHPLPVHPRSSANNCTLRSMLRKRRSTTWR
jgi:hypothetical protein